MQSDKRAIATRIAWHFLGKPYLWGGDNPIAGFDCSGFVIEILKSVGILPHKGDWTAAGLLGKFTPQIVQSPHEGCLAFFGSTEKITHVEYCLTPAFTIGASGGGSKTDSEQAAIDQDAYIKIRPIKVRSNLVAVADPFRGVS